MPISAEAVPMSALGRTLRAILAWHSMLILILAGCSPRESSKSIVVYSSVDEAYSRPLSRMFEERTGIRVKLVSDTEAAKSAGLVTRLLEERDHPQADLFWSGDLMRALDLARAGVAEPALPPVQGPGRLRVLIRHRVPGANRGDAPGSVLDLAKPEFASRSCLANPLFGTTSMHAAVLLQIYGPEGAERFFNDFARNGGRMLASNGEVKRRVGSGEFEFGLTDSDDANVALLDGMPVSVIVPDQGPEAVGAVMLPTAVLHVAGAPHPKDAAAFAGFLGAAETTRWMAESSAAFFPPNDPGYAPGKLEISLDKVKLLRIDHDDLGVQFENWRQTFLEPWVRDQQL